MKKMLFALACSVLISMAFNQRASACSCQPQGFNFCETVHGDTTFISLIGMFKKIDTLAYGFKVVKLATFFGQEPRDTFWVWGDNGALCRIYDPWQIGDTMVMALQTCDTAGNYFSNPDYPPNLESVNDYQISVCGAYSLDVRNDSVIGYITVSALQSIPLDEFISQNCALLLNAIPDGEGQEALNIFPVPANDKLSIRNLPDRPVNIVIYDNLGACISRLTSTGTNMDIPLNSYPAGNYFIRFFYSEGIVSKKFQIMQ